jgi:hypothetical protein
VSAGFWTELRLRALRHGLWIGAACSAIIAASVVTESRFGVDAHAYWSASHRHALYAVAAHHVDSYPYSPAFAQAIWPLAQLPWLAFCVVWTAAVGAIYLWLLAPLDWRWRAPLLLLCSPDIVTGNVWSMFALVLVFGLRRPAAWAFPLLTKATPVVGPIWFAARREWRALTVTLGTTLAIAAISFAINPGAWWAWIRFLLHEGRAPGRDSRLVVPLLHPPAVVYVAFALPAAAVLTIHAARRDRPWMVPVAMAISAPFFTVNAFATLTAIPRLIEPGRQLEAARGRRRRRTAPDALALPGTPLPRPSRRPA